MARRTSILALILALPLQPVAAATQAVPPSCPGIPGQGVAMADLGARGPHRLIDANFPDPFIARVGEGFYAYATGNQIGGGQMNVQVARSRELTRWSEPIEALPAANLPAWVDRAHPQVWAPEMLAHNGRYVLYFNARHATLTRTEGPAEAPVVRQRHCIGAAVAGRPEGPFAGIDEPLVCADFPDGVIDAGIFRDGASLYLLYKDDGNCCDRGSAIYSQGLSSGGLAALGPRHRLVANNDGPEEHDDWEWRVVEAPTMVRRGGSYILFYSGNFFGNRNYSVADLACASPRGPCRDSGDNPILRSHDGFSLIGPGHQSLLDEGGRTYLFFHGWNADPDGREQPGVHKRCLYVAQVQWQRLPNGDERPRIPGGTPTNRR